MGKCNFPEVYKYISNRRYLVRVCLTKQSRDICLEINREAKLRRIIFIGIGVVLLLLLLHYAYASFVSFGGCVEIRNGKGQ
jgi:hypothetical protein